MPSFKINAKSEEVKSGFESYDGEVPLKKGFYRAKIKSIKHKLNSKGSRGFQIVTEMEAAKGDPKDHAQYDGYPMFINSIITESADGTAMKEGAIANLSNFLNAIGAGDNPAVVTATGDADAGVDVLKIGGKNPVGAIVAIDLGTEDYDGEKRPKSNGLYKAKDEVAGKGGKKPAFVPAEEDDDLLEGDEEADETEEGDEEEGDEEYNARAAELEGMQIAALKKIAKDLKVALGGKKDELIERILEAEFTAAALDEDEEDDEEEDEEDDVEVDEDEEEEEDDEEDDGSDERRAELDAISERTALKKILAEVNPDFRVLKRTTEVELRDAIMTAEFGSSDTPF